MNAARWQAQCGAGEDRALLEEALEQAIEAAATFEAEITEHYHGFIQCIYREPLILPDHVQAWIPSRGLERTICDYIAGITDRYAIDEHERLHYPYLKP